MTRLRMMMLLLGLAFVAALAIGGELAGQHVAAQVRQPANYPPGIVSTSWVRCGSVLSPTDNRPDAGWAYSDKSCAQKLAELRTATWRWFAGTVTAMSAAVLIAAVVRRVRRRRHGIELTSRACPS
jgi:hypothetical protein